MFFESLVNLLISVLNILLPIQSFPDGHDQLLHNQAILGAVGAENAHFEQRVDVGDLLAGGHHHYHFV